MWRCLRRLRRRWMRRRPARSGVKIDCRPGSVPGSRARRANAVSSSSAATWQEICSSRDSKRVAPGRMQTERLTWHCDTQLQGHAGAMTSAGKPSEVFQMSRLSPGADVCVAQVRGLFRRELVLLLQLSQPVCGIGGHRRGIGRLQVEAIEARRVQTEYSLLDRAVGVAEGRKVAPTSCMRSTNESLPLRLAQPLLQQDCSKFYQTSLQAVSFRSLLAGQIRTGTPTSTGLLRLGGAARGATSQLHQRRRVEAADSSPSNRAAFSRAAMAKLASALVSVISVSRRLRSCSKSAR